MVDVSMMKIFFFSIYFCWIFVYRNVSSQTYYCLANSSCGCSVQAAVLTKIVGGETARSQTWGWAVSIRRKSTNSHFCGGTIISAQHVLTAAHCAVGFTPASSIRVYVGSIYLSSTNQARDVSAVHIHPGYNSNTFLNDIAILKVSSPFDLSRAGVDLICLPNVSSTFLASREYPAANTILIAIGWGYLYQNAQVVSNTLQQVTIRAVSASSQYCTSALVSDRTKQFCAGIMPQGGKDTCQGDSGGPLLMFTSANVWEQVGITSNGDGCAKPGSPGVYTRVASYQSWINEIMNEANYHPLNIYMIFMSIIFSIFFQ